jgi:glucosamine kinase
MVEYLIGIDGGGTGTRARLADAEGDELSVGRSGPSGLVRGIDAAWAAIDDAVAQAFAAASIRRPPNSAVAIGLGLAGANNKPWAAAFAAAHPGYGEVVVETDGFASLLGAHGGRPGAIVAVGTGSVGVALTANALRREVGGWGFPSGDEGSGAWLGLRAVNHAEQVMDGRQPAGPLARAVIDACGGSRDGALAWAVQARQVDYAALAPLVFAQADADSVARGLLVEAGRLVAAIARTLDPSGELPLALCGGLSLPLRPYLPPALVERAVAPRADAAAGALYMVRRPVARRAVQRRSTV